jgi:hypothetical protein
MNQIITQSFFKKIARFFLPHYVSLEKTDRHLNNIAYMIECGKHSGFPPCCIRFYISQKIWMSDRASQRYSAKVARSGLGYRYMPCPKCLRQKHVVETLPCPTGSHCFFIDEPWEPAPAGMLSFPPTLQRLNAEILNSKLLLKQQKELLDKQQTIILEKFP